MEQEKVYFLNDDGEIVDKEVATKAIIRMEDENGNLIKESFFYLDNKKDNDESLDKNK